MHAPHATAQGLMRIPTWAVVTQMACLAAFVAGESDAECWQRTGRWKRRAAPSRLTVIFHVMAAPTEVTGESFDGQLKLVGASLCRVVSRSTSRAPLDAWAVPSGMSETLSAVLAGECWTEGAQMALL